MMKLPDFERRFTLLVVTGVMLMVLLYAFLRPMLMFFGGSANTLPYAVEYMKIYIAGTIAGQVSLGMNYFINSQGYTRTGMISVVCGAVANIILDPILIFGFNMGIKGACNSNRHIADNIRSMGYGFPVQ